jgi:hypothetical protein
MPQLKLQCPYCPKISSRGTGLASHIRGTHPDRYSSWRKSRGNSSSTAAPQAASGSGAATGGLKAIIAGLEQQQAAIASALAALREIGGMTASGSVSDSNTETESAAPRKRRGMSPEGKRRLIAALKRRWAEKRKAGNAAKKAS